MKRATATLLALLLTSACAHANGGGWSPRATTPAAGAKRILDSLTDPRRVSIPEDVRRASRAGTPPGSPSPAAPAASPSAGGTCLEAQLAATADRLRAEEWSRQAASALGTPTRVLPGGGLYRVRAGTCLDRASADALVARARASGWSGAYVTPAQ